jgi:hypothetical protein
MKDQTLPVNRGILVVAAGAWRHERGRSLADQGYKVFW